MGVNRVKFACGTRRSESVLRSLSVSFVSNLLIAGLLLATGQSIGARTAPHAVHSNSGESAISNAILGIKINSADPKANLHQACANSDFKLLALGLEGIQSRINVPKGEFETDAEFAERTGKIASILNGSQPIIVCQPLNDNEDAPFTYDAEREVFKGTFAPHQNVWRNSKRLGSYVSHTRMGVRATITASLEFDYDVDMGESLKQLTEGCAKYDYGSFSYEVPVPRSEAPAVKARGYLVFLGGLVAPFIDKDDTPGSPTLDDPQDVYERDVTVHFIPSQIVLVGPNGDRLWQCASKTASAAKQHLQLVAAN